MSIQAPDDTVKIIETLIGSCERLLRDAPLHSRLLAQGAIIDAKDLVAELTGRERIDTHQAAVNTIVDEARKVQP